MSRALPPDPLPLRSAQTEPLVKTSDGDGEAAGPRSTLPRSGRRRQTKTSPPSAGPVGPPTARGVAGVPPPAPGPPEPFPSQFGSRAPGDKEGGRAGGGGGTRVATPLRARREAFGGVPSHPATPGSLARSRSRRRRRFRGASECARPRPARVPPQAAAHPAVGAPEAASSAGPRPVPPAAASWAPRRHHLRRLAATAAATAFFASALSRG